MTPEMKNVYKEFRAAEVIGPVDSGERMRSKKGSKISDSDKDWVSTNRTV